MKKLCLFVVVLVLSGVLVAANVEGQALAADAKWSASYWNNKRLEGTPVVTREESKIDYDWGTSRPVSGVNKDKFSARWRRTVTFKEAGTYRFRATMDDGMRVWVDGKLIIDEWDLNDAPTVTADVKLGKGDHKIKVEYFEEGGNAVAKLSWAKVEASSPTTFKNWKGQYYNNRGLSGSPVLERDDASINFDWGSGSPASGVNVDNFSVRWTRKLDFNAGTYRFSMTTDDGARLWVDDNLVIDRWFDRAATTYTVDVALGAGSHDVEMEYYESAGGASARLTWQAVMATTPTSTPVPGGTSSGRTYTVKSGDTLSGIARNNGTTVAVLVNLNGPTYPSLYTNPSLIYTGWVLKLPGSGQSDGGTGSGGTYTVQRGDYLALISQKTGVSVSDLVRLNAARYPSLRTNPNVIYTGWVLRLL